MAGDGKYPIEINKTRKGEYGEWGPLTIYFTQDLIVFGQSIKWNDDPYIVYTMGLIL